MEEEKQHKDKRSHKVRKLEPLITPIPNRTRRRKRQIRLRNQSNHTRPVEHTRVPLLHHIALPDVEDDKRERVHQGQDEHGIADPSVEDLQLLVADARHGGDEIALGAERDDER